MRSLGEADWYGYRVEVPLTGREPIVGRLRNRLRRRGAGWGWVTLQGPSGAGITRMLREASLLIRGEVGPEPIWIRPCRGAAVPLEPLRRALAPLLGERDGAAGARSLRAMVSAPGAEVDTLATWLLAGSTDPQVVRPTVRAARALLERLVPAGVLLVDDYDLLDEGTRAVLAPSIDHQGPGVIAGISGDAALAPDSTVWPLDPLAAAQVELLLKRWLRHTATARRLAPEMVARYGGWPGRIIEAVRGLGQDGHLVREPRGVVVRTMPKRWPSGSRPDDAFLRWARALGAPAARLLEIAGLHGEPLDTPLLADAAGVKNSFVDAVRAEAAASRDGAMAGFLFATEAERRAIAATLSPERRDELGARLAEAWARRDPETDDGACTALGRVVAYVLGRRRAEAVGHLEPALDRLARTTVRSDCDLRRLERLGRLFGPPKDPSERGPLVRLAEMLLAHGRGDAARNVLSGTVDRSDLRAIWLTARLDLANGHINEAHARLADGLPHGQSGIDPVRFDAWALQARLCLQMGDREGARDAWREAGKALSPGDLARRASFHQGAAACAAHAGRRRAVASHLRRAVGMLESVGHIKEAACVWARLGEIETDLDHASAAVECFARAAHLHHVVGASDAEARARLALGRTYLGVSCYDQAAEELETALDVAADSSLGPLLAEVHLALAAAHRGRGDLANERVHAAEAAGLPAPAHLTLRARSLLAAADLRAGAPGAMRLLERCEQELRAAGLEAEADEARALLFDARLRSGNMRSAAALLHDQPGAPSLRLGRARLDLVSGREPEASVSLERLACDPSLSIDLRTVAYGHLAEALLRQGRLREARAAAVSASALLEVQHRSRRDDLRTHRILARVFQGLGDEGRAAGHRAAARRHLRSLLAAAVNPRESLRLARAQWRTDPRRDAVQIA